MKLTKKMCALTAGVLLITGSVGSGWAEDKKEEPKPYSTAAVTFASKYIWRGYE